MNWFFVLCALLSCYFCYVATSEIKPLKGSNYLLSFNREDIFEKCALFPEHFISKAFDLSDLKFEFLPDDTIKVTGTIKYILALPPNHKVTSEAEVLRKTNGQWVNTMYNMRRVDTCFSLFNPAEVWHPYVKMISSELKPCPPKKDTTFNVNIIANPNVGGIQDRHADGEYKLECKMFYGPKPEDFICFEMHFNLEKQ